MASDGRAAKRRAAAKKAAATRRRNAQAGGESATPGPLALLEAIRGQFTEAGVDGVLVLRLAGAPDATGNQEVQYVSVGLGATQPEAVPAILTKASKIAGQPFGL